jgi:hypothetical protein
LTDKLVKAAAQFETIAKELEMAAQHYKTAANHFRNGEVPRASAHAFAGWGHMNEAEQMLKAQSIVHAQHSKP